MVIEMNTIRITDSQIREIETYLNSANDSMIKNNGLSSARYFAGAIEGIAMVLKFFGISCLRVNGVWRVGLMD